MDVRHDKLNRHLDNKKLEVENKHAMRLIN